MATDRLAIVIFNLGGPDSLAAVRPFLFNLFNDRAIIDLPAVLRWPLAQFISRTRAAKSRGYYEALGGRSPIVDETRAQAEALEKAAASLAATVKVFTFMRYWHPLAAEAVAQIKAFAPDRVVLLPLYPQFSTTTTGTSLAAFAGEAARQGLTVPFDTVCCYPVLDGLIESIAASVRAAYFTHGDAPRVIFSAHGLPLKTIAAGDPYQWQVECTATAVVARLAIPGLDWVLAYQSRVGPLAWLGPSIEEEIGRAGRDRRAVIVAPIAFVSEHVETLYELDVTIEGLARSVGVPRYARTPAVGCARAFIAGLTALAAQAHGTCPAGEGRLCPALYNKCPASGPATALAGAGDR